MSLTKKISELQTGLIAVMEKVECLSSCKEKGIGRTGMDFKAAKEILLNKEYDVVVCGEVKKGKSSLINAIIGQEDLLPVDCDIATSQVFRISNSPVESYKLVFTDGTERVIAREELGKYGSQIAANINGSPTLGGKFIDYIQILQPIGFLPEEVSIVDTPGLGSLYSAHEKITQNYISRAAAVVFVLDYERPIADQERNFINKVLDVTPYILFVITKSDRYDESTRNAIIARNEEILAEIYAPRNLKVPQICQVSATELIASRTSKSEIWGKQHYADSGYKDVEELLMRTIYRAVALLRTTNALSVTVSHVNETNKSIAERLQSCLDDQQDMQRKLEEEKRRIQREFEDGNGTIIKKRNEIVREITTICNSVSNRVSQIFSQSGDVWQMAFSSFDSISSSEEAKALCNSLPTAIANEISNQWEIISTDLQRQVFACLSEINVTMSSVYCEGFYGGYSLDVPQMTKSEKVNVFTRGFMGVSMGSAIGGLIGSFFGPVGTAVGMGIGSAIGGVTTGTAANIDQIKNSLRKEVQKMLVEMRSELLDVPNGGSLSKAGRFAKDLQEAATSAIDEMVRNRKKQLEEELEELSRRSRLDMELKQKELSKWKNLQNDWKEETEHLRSLIGLRKEIVEALKEQ